MNTWAVTRNFTKPQILNWKYRTTYLNALCTNSVVTIIPLKNSLYPDCKRDTWKSTPVSSLKYFWQCITFTSKIHEINHHYCSENKLNNIKQNYLLVLKPNVNTKQLSLLWSSLVTKTRLSKMECKQQCFPSSCGITAVTR